MIASRAFHAVETGPAADAPRRFNLYGVPVNLSAAVPQLAHEVRRLMGAFDGRGQPADLRRGLSPVTGSVRTFDSSEAMKQLSPAARRVTPVLGRVARPVMELYQDAERSWLVDDRWGMAEVNLLKSTWRSWVLPEPVVNARRCADLAVMWPAAQVLRGRGLTFLPAASVVRDGWGVLIVSPFDIDAQLDELAQAGYRINARRWTCLCEDAGRVMLLPAGRDAAAGAVPCDVVMIVAPAHRPLARATELPSQLALDALREAWPIAELHRSRLALPARLATSCRCCAAQLARRPEDLLALLAPLRPQAVTARPVVPPAPPRRYHAARPSRAA